MDNYLSYRWPDPPPEGWTADGSRKETRDRQVLRNVLVALLLVALLAGLAAGCWLLARHMIRRWTAEQWTRSDALPAYSRPAATAPPETTLPRAEVGLGVSLELDRTLVQTISAREIYDMVLPSVVSVIAESSGGYGMGSGVIMGEDGYILTNYHVIEGAGAVTVMALDSEDVYGARLVGYDREQDLAVLKVDAEGLTAARFGDSDELRVGDVAYAIGNPLGYLYGTITDGIVSYLDRTQTIDGHEMTLIQTSAILNSGSSGGALVNERGQVVGITVAKVSGPATAEEAQVEGLGFAIPISAARPFVNRILDTGETWRPVMGIACLAGEVDGETGILIREVTPEGPADAAGIWPGDLIVSAGGRSTETVYALKRVLNEAGVGGSVTCIVLRRGERLEFTLTLVDSADLP